VRFSTRKQSFTQKGGGCVVDDGGEKRNWGEREENNKDKRGKLGIGARNPPISHSSLDPRHNTERRRTLRRRFMLLPCRPSTLPPGCLDSDPFLQQLVPLVLSPSRLTYSANSPLATAHQVLPAQLVLVLQTCSTCCCVCLLLLLLLKLAENYTISCSRL
jgi:hypothetical protein